MLPPVEIMPLKIKVSNIPSDEQPGVSFIILAEF
jgi:hypothetical protein